MSVPVTLSDLEIGTLLANFLFWIILYRLVPFDLEVPNLPW